MKGLDFMNLRNLLKPGDFVFPVPIGIRTTLQYNVSGNLEKVFVGYTDVREEVTDAVMSKLVDYHIVPTSIHIKNGTSWVKGVLYTATLVEEDGILPQAVEKTLIDTLISNPTQFNFFAHSMSSTSTVFRGVTPTKLALSISKFRVLPGWIVPNKIENSLLNKWASDNTFSFNPIITDLAIYRGESVQYMSMHTSQFTVLGAKQYIDDNGYIKVALKKSDGSKLYIDYSDFVRWGVGAFSNVVLDSDKQIIHVKNSDRTYSYKDTITCPRCGKVYKIPESGTVQCPDIHCPTRLLSAVVNFANVMNLPNFSVPIAREWLREKMVTCIPDILILDDYKDSKFKATIPKILRSLIPAESIRTDDVFKLFVIGCNSNYQTFEYYVNNPDRITSDMNIQHPDIMTFVNWLNDGYNASDLLTMVNSEQLDIDWVSKKFEGAPIFRGKVIYVTGDFIRGSIAEISEILESYSAKVVTNMSETVNCVIIGGTRDNVNGKVVNNARTLGIPVFEEDTFFYQYEIDSDIANYT